ncbi:LacI family DNA-binding transcriptional regulator [Leuconostoc gelidum subsp. gelidum]|uniref:LacI family DNA-binding transcriptional regulator n=1 Tax=Leuconostoc gelidum TaxID=1244 RepID=UPI001CC57DA3|nr:LacI family DNA-binding transcriptional regulator [Leuconostoc gelidum]MBZ6013268.1 LacI family DNA-binding transcriptional regulator [Leuconostoc gelidum subsp. gelidum]
MVNLADVAHQVHVSKMTVSRVINHPEKVSAEVRESVMAAIDLIGYQPNRIAKALVNHQNYVIQFLVLEDIVTVEPNYAILLLQLADVLNQKGYTLEISTTITDNNHIDGVIVSGWRQSDLPALEALRVPVVLYGESPTDHDMAYVDVDNRLGTTLATNHMIEVGYQKIIYIGMAVDLPFSHERELGYLYTMAANKRVSRVYTVSNHSHAAEQLIHNIMAQLPENTGVVCATDRIALGVVRALNKQNGVPKKYGVIGFDGVFIDQISSPQLTTLRQPFAKISKSLVDNLFLQLQNGELGMQRIAPDLMYRDTTRAKKRCYR